MNMTTGLYFMYIQYFREFRNLTKQWRTWPWPLPRVCDQTGPLFRLGAAFLQGHDPQCRNWPLLTSWLLHATVPITNRHSPTVRTTSYITMKLNIFWRHWIDLSELLTIYLIQVFKKKRKKKYNKFDKRKEISFTIIICAFIVHN